MTKTEAVIHYKAAVAVFEKWLKLGFISPEDFTVIDTITAAKYGLSSCSIYRRNDLLYHENRANIE